MKIKKAVITAAGFGTRFLPYTKTIQKEMMPVVDKPILDYVVDDCLAAGIEEIVFVVNARTRNQIESYYSENITLYKYLEKMGKLDKYSKVENIHTKAKYSYVEQPDNGEYGTAVPLKLVKDHVLNEDAFIMFMGDNFILNTDGKTEAQKMVEKFLSGEYEAMMNTITVPQDQVSKYGIVNCKKIADDLILENILEKPNREEVNTNLANISQYIFKPSVYKYLDVQANNEKRNELEITDTIVSVAKEGKVLVHTATGKYMDCGFPEGWLKVNNEMLGLH